LLPQEYSYQKQEGFKPYSIQNTYRINESAPVETLDRNNIKDEIKTMSRNCKWRVQKNLNFTKK
jgi:hypothetical protein